MKNIIKITLFLFVPMLIGCSDDEATPDYRELVTGSYTTWVDVYYDKDRISYDDSFGKAQIEVISSSSNSKGVDIFFDGQKTMSLQLVVRAYNGVAFNVVPTTDFEGLAELDLDGNKYHAVYYSDSDLLTFDVKNLDNGKVVGYTRTTISGQH